jgi:hypothetical protein
MFDRRDARLLLGIRRGKGTLTEEGYTENATTLDSPSVELPNAWLAL